MPREKCLETEARTPGGSLPPSTLQPLTHHRPNQLAQEEETPSQEEQQAKRKQANPWKGEGNLTKDTPLKNRTEQTQILTRVPHEIKDVMFCMKQKLRDTRALERNKRTIAGDERYASKAQEIN